MLMAGEGSDEKKANALKTSLDYLDLFLSGPNSYVAGSDITIADFSILASITQLEALDFKLAGYK
jgi:glutathione S-transferase